MKVYIPKYAYKIKVFMYKGQVKARGTAQANNGQAYPMEQEKEY